MMVLPLAALHPLNLAGFLLLGLATLWTIRAVAIAGGRDADDVLSRLLNIAAVLMCAGGIFGVAAALVGPTAIPLVTAGFFVVAMSVGKYLDAQRRSMLWVLSASARYGIPLDESARAFAAEQRSIGGHRYHRLAELLSSGVPLDAAIERCHHVLPGDAELAVRFGASIGQLVPALERVVKAPDDSQWIQRSLLERFIYFSILLLLVSLMLAYVSSALAPTILGLLIQNVRGLDEGNVEKIAETLEFWWFVPLPLAVLMSGFVLLGLVYYAGWRTTELPLVGRLTRRLDGAQVLRCLAVGVRAGRPIPGVLGAIAEKHPRKYFRRRLAACTEQIDAGENWLVALSERQLIVADEAAVLGAALRAGNLAWALDELAETRERRYMLKLQATAQILLPIILVALGLIVLGAALLVFAPTYYLLQYQL